MKASPRLVGLVVLSGVLAAGASAFAADAGDAIFGLDLADRTRLEVIYDHIGRDLRNTSGPELSDELDADSLYLRFHTDVGQYASFDIDLGGVKPENGDYDYYVGAGLRYLAYNLDAWRVSVVAQVHYSPMETDRGGYQSEFDYVEGDGAVLLTRLINIREQFTLMPYVGPMLSIVRMDGDVREEDRGVSEDFDVEESNAIGAVAGISFKFKESHSVRLETRYFDRVTISVGAGVTF